MDGTGSLCNLLFPGSDNPTANEYLAFLALRVPHDIADQLHVDGQPDIGMPHARVDTADLVQPLSTKLFPTEKLADIADLLGYILFTYEVGIDEKHNDDDPFKVIFTASLYLHCFVRGGGVPEGSGYLAALRVMAAVSSTLDVEARFQVVRFLGSLVPGFPASSICEPAPLSSLILTLSVIVGSILSDLGVVAKEIMKGENIEQAWKASQEWVDSPEAAEAWQVMHDRISAMRQMLSQMFGIYGRVRQSADCFLLDQ